MASTPVNSSQQFLQNCIAIATDIVKRPLEHLWMDYDKEADVLYISFRHPQNADVTEEIEEDVLLRKKNDEIVGITILNASLK